jgi:hypothetical protein
MLYLLAEEDGCKYACFLHTSQFLLSLPSVSDVRNYLNVWSGSINVFSTKNKHCLAKSKHCDPFIDSLFHRVKIASDRITMSLSVEENLAEMC